MIYICRWKKVPPLFCIMDFLQDRTRSVYALLWIIVSLFCGIECCENQTILCSYASTRDELCNNALCDCYITAYRGPRHITCNGVLSEIPLGQFQEDIDLAFVTSNNITIIKNRTFSGLSTSRLHLNNNKIKTIETSAFENIKYMGYLDLSANYITAIGERTFKNLNSLQVLKLDNNKINTIATSAFESMGSLLHLDLSKNLIKAVGRWTFRNLPSLSDLRLSNNLIMDLAPQAFINLPYLSELYMDNNKLKSVGSLAFSHIPNLRILQMSFNEIAVIEDHAFRRISVDTLDLQYNKFTNISKGAFRYLPKGYTILLQFNEIEEIQSQAFQNIYNVSNIITSSKVKRIESYAFSDIKSDSLQIVIASGSLQSIEQNAFYNITGNILVLGVSEDVSFKENLIYSSFNNIYFTQNTHSLNCNCTMMWIALWLQGGKNRESIRNDASCNDPNNTLVSNLTLDNFAYCREMPDRYECYETEAIIVNCSFSFVSGHFIEWIHSRNGRHIRTLKTLTNILSIPFCSLDDIGDYTCVRSTLYPAVPYINTTTTLHVKGKPIVVNRQTHTNGADLVLSVTIFTTNDVDIHWLLDGIKLTNDAVHLINTLVVPLKTIQYNTQLVVDGFMTNLTIRNYNSLSTRDYTCRISNEIGTVEEVLLSRPIDIVLQPNTLCETSSKFEIDCTINTDGAIPRYFKHMVDGKLIRTLPGTRMNNTYTLVIPFCNFQDQGEYTCYWETGVPGLEVVSKTTKLIVNGPPIILYYTETSVDRLIILSVMFLSHPYPMEPQWYFNDNAIVPSSEIQQTTAFSVVEMELHRVTAYVNGFISNLTMKEGQAGLGDYKCVVKNDYGRSDKIITRHEGFSRSNDAADESTNNLMSIILGSVAAGLTIVVIIFVVVSVKRRKQSTQGSRTCNESTNRSANGSDTYDSIRMSNNGSRLCRNNRIKLF